jgi:hypothetical protein
MRHILQEKEKDKYDSIISSLFLCLHAEHYWIRQSWGLKEILNLAGHVMPVPEARVSGSETIRTTPFSVTN